MKRLLIIGLLFIALVIVMFFALSPAKDTTITQARPSPSPYSLPTITTLRDVIPERSTAPDVQAALGQPKSVSTNGQISTLLYPSKNIYWDNEIVILNTTVVFTREYIFPPDETSLVKLTRTISESPTLLYGPGSPGGIYLIVYPKTGVAFEANTSQDTVYQIWRFPSTTLQSFLTIPQASTYSIQQHALPEGGNSSQ